MATKTGDKTMNTTPHFDPLLDDELADALDWAGYDFNALPVATREGYWGDCDFSGAKAVGISWTNSYLRSANFRKADLRGADFCAALLSGADFRDADLTGASFELATISRTNFRGAKLPELSAFKGAFVGHGKVEHIARRTNLPMRYVEYAYKTSMEVIARLEAQRTESIYMQNDWASPQSIDKK